VLVTVAEAVSTNVGMSLVVIIGAEVNVEIVVGVRVLVFVAARVFANIAIGVLAEGGVGVSVLVGVGVNVFVSFWLNLNVAVVVSPAGTIDSLANTPLMCGIVITKIIQATPRAIPKTLNFDIRHSPIVPIISLRKIE